MNLKSLYITRQEWKPGKPLAMKVEFSHSAGEIAINIPENRHQAILEAVADLLTEAATMQAGNIRAAIVEAAPQPEAITAD